MSAYVVDEAHVAYLIQAAVHYRSGVQWEGRYIHLFQATSGELERFGQMLWDENVNSVRARYPGSDDLPGPIGCDYTYRDGRYFFPTINPIQVIKSARCYEYQSCGHDQWADSPAKRFIDSLVSNAIQNLPGYNKAIWGCPKNKF